MVEFEEATLVEKPYILIDGVKHYVEPAQYSGGIPVTPAILNKIQRDLENLIPEGYISVYNSTTQSFTKKTQAKVNFNSLNIGLQVFTLSNNEITCEKEGTIAISYKLFLASSFADQDNIIVKVYKNNNEISRTQYRPNGAASQSLVSDTVFTQVNMGDTIHLELIDYSNNVVIGNTSANIANILNARYIGI